MKELSIEEKAKAYDEAVSKSIEFYTLCKKCGVKETVDFLEDIFSELKESEDERIRKELIEFIKSRGGFKQEYIDWLEKQGEKPQGKTALEASNEEKVDNANKVEPKFKVGKWIIDKSGLAQQVLDFRSGVYTCTYNNFTTDCESNYRLWTIADAKDGDVLYSLDSNQPFIYKERNMHGQATAYCGINKYGKFFVWNTKDCIIKLDKYIPTTREQRDTLMKAMADAGYEWDVKKKELKKIRQKPTIDYIDSLIDSHPKDNWELVHEFVEKFGRIPEDEDELNVLVEYVLKRQKPTAWSEEDETGLTNTIIMLKEGASLHFIKNDITKAVDWLKSLKDRVQPQKQWKPSEEQLEFLKKCIESYNEVSFPTEFRLFRTLYNDLKKLTE